MLLIFCAVCVIIVCLLEIFLLLKIQHALNRLCDVAEFFCYLTYMTATFVVVFPSKSLIGISFNQQIAFF